MRGFTGRTPTKSHFLKIVLFIERGLSAEKTLYISGRAEFVHYCTDEVCKEVKVGENEGKDNAWEQEAPGSAP